MFFIVYHFSPQYVSPRYAYLHLYLGRRATTFSFTVCWKQFLLNQDDVLQYILLVA